MISWKEIFLKIQITSLNNLIFLKLIWTRAHFLITKSSIINCSQYQPKLQINCIQLMLLLTITCTTKVITFTHTSLLLVNKQKDLWLLLYFSCPQKAKISLHLDLECTVNNLSFLFIYSSPGECVYFTSLPSNKIHMLSNRLLIKVIRCS